MILKMILNGDVVLEPEAVGVHPPPLNVSPARAWLYNSIIFIQDQKIASFVLDFEIGRVENLLGCKNFIHLTCEVYAIFTELSAESEKRDE